jgi:hypothetical protein
MKHSISSALFSGALLLGLSACTKSSSTGGSSKPPSTLTVSTSSAAKGQPVTVTLPTTLENTPVQWGVYPSNLTHVTPGKSQAVVLFGNAGTYHVFAGYANGADSTHDTVTVVVTDSVYNPPPPVSYDTTSLLSDVITLTPVIDSNAQLFLVAQTGKSYESPTLLYNVTANGGWSGGLDISFYGVSTIQGSGYMTPGYAYLFLDNNTRPAAGTYPLTVTVDGTQYTGTVTATTSGYSFSWNYTTGVVISPQQVTF